jgi:hypothetical protein
MPGRGTRPRSPIAGHHRGRLLADDRLCDLRQSAMRAKAIRGRGQIFPGMARACLVLAAPCCTAWMPQRPRRLAPGSGQAKHHRHAVAVLAGQPDPPRVTLLGSGS